MSDSATEDEDRLPWLQSAEPEFEDDGPGALKVAILVLVGLLVIAAAFYGWWRYHQHSQSDGSGELINAQEGDYKVKPDESGGMKVASGGDTRFATSDGGISNGSVDVSQLPEAPVNGKTVPTPKPSQSPGASKVVAQVPQNAENLNANAAKQKRSTSAPDGSAGGSVVQLGSFPSSSEADSAWKSLSGRFSYLAPLGEAVQKAEVNGSTVYRLRVNAGSAGAAKQVCAKLKVAGQACYIP